MEGKEQKEKKKREEGNETERVCGGEWVLMRSCTIIGGGSQSTQQRDPERERERERPSRDIGPRTNPERP
jgi:hypothetical protein